MSGLRSLGCGDKAESEAARLAGSLPSRPSPGTRARRVSRGSRAQQAAAPGGCGAGAQGPEAGTRDGPARLPGGVTRGGAPWAGRRRPGERRGRQDAERGGPERGRGRAMSGGAGAGAGPRRPGPRSLSCVSEADGAAGAGSRAGSGAGAPRRARSLPGSPERRPPGAGCGRPLRVRFADALGLELAQVRLFRAGERPAVPPHVLSRLAAPAAPAFTLRCLVPDFAPPVDAPGFGERVRRQRVCLERVTCSDLGVRGSVRVCNVAFEKQVAVRYTLSGWRRAHEAAARWRGPAGAAGAEDVFAFAFPVPPFVLARGARVHFALRYRVAGAEYWDNNDGRDYSLTVREHPLRLPPGECEESWIHFV
ncbi:protein phosphatase 1 regulatory subunit 3D [Sorex araneus]|uniref:protein phosphatase 1 regulatory subunit 3D n=1 Tax=Sorex araneus TaxID=42254 RepID=UPI002433F7C7|nr:protein phosphatase 1 regulatory subunit 3D [Sorex araneus]